MTEPLAGPAHDASSAGALLRAAREKQGLHIAALAASIKVSPRKLDALENDRYDELPDATFTRALAQTVCRTLKIDARPVLERMPPAPSVVALQPGSGGLNTPFRERPGREDPGLVVGVARKPMLWAALLFVVAALAVIFVPGHWWAALQPASGVAAVPVALPASAGAVPALAASAPELAASAAPPAASQALIETVFAPQGPEAAASEPASALATAAAAPATLAAPAPAAAASLLQLRSTEPSWVEVRDSRGVLLLSRTVQPGETVGVDGSLPLRLVIGNASGTQLAFRGQPYDLGPSTRENVARVELR